MTMSKAPKESFLLEHIEPVEFKKLLYGKSVEFHKIKRHIKFSSEFHEPGYIYYDQIRRMKIKNQAERKHTLLIWAMVLLLVFVGIFLFYIRAHLPPWSIQIELKNTPPKSKPIEIGARIDNTEAKRLADFCEPDFPVALIFHKEKGSN
jgi:hypothetical protein